MSTEIRDLMRRAEEAQRHATELAAEGRIAEAILERRDACRLYLEALALQPMTAAMAAETV